MWDSIERRQFVRAKFPCIITLYRPKKYTISVNLENISAGGIRVIIKEKLKVSALINLDILKVSKKAIKCQGRIKWVFTRRKYKNKNQIVFDTGIEFLQIKENDIRKIKHLVASVASGRATPKRKYHQP